MIIEKKKGASEKARHEMLSPSRCRKTSVRYQKGDYRRPFLKEIERQRVKEGKRNGNGVMAIDREIIQPAFFLLVTHESRTSALSIAIASQKRLIFPSVCRRTCHRLPSFYSACII